MLDTLKQKDVSLNLTDQNYILHLILIHYKPEEILA
jgi:hypothetical protein